MSVVCHWLVPGVGTEANQGNECWGIHVVLYTWGRKKFTNISNLNKRDGGIQNFVKIVDSNHSEVIGIYCFPTPLDI